MSEQDTDKEDTGREPDDRLVLDADDLEEALSEGCKALNLFWEVAEPLLRRNATRNLMAGLSSNYYRGYDALRHSFGRIQGAVRHASDGTSVWEDAPMTAVTNESEGRNGQTERPEMVASGRRSGAWPSGMGSAEAAEAHGPTGPDGWQVEPGAAASGALCHARRETEAEKKHRKAAAAEAKRVAAIRKASARRSAVRRVKRR